MMDDVSGKKEKKQLDKKEKIEEDNEVKEETVDALYDLNDNDHPVVSNVTMGDAEEYFNDLGLEYNVDYKEKKVEKVTGRRSDKKVDVPEEKNEDSLFDLIDSMYQDSEEE